jgi:hypothetical protein
MVSHSEAQDFKYGRVSKEELQEKVHPSFPEANAAILYRDNYSHFEYNKQDGFLLVSEFHERIKIYNSEGFKNGTRQISLYKDGNKEEKLNGLRAVTYNLEDGKIRENKLDNDDIFEEEQSKYSDVVKFTMPNLKEGTVVEYKYTVQSPFLGNLDEVRFQERIPVNKAEARYYFPEYFVFKMHTKGWHKLKIDESIKNRKLNLGTSFDRSGGNKFSVRQSTARNRSIDFKENIYEVSASDVPPVKEESFSGNLDNYLTAVKFELSYIQYPGEPLEYVSSTWKDVAKTIYDSDAFGNELHRSHYFEDDLDEVLADVSTTKEKMLLIFEFVKKRMTWNGYMGYYAEKGLKQAFKKQSGNTADINLMLVAMLRYAGFEANPVLVSTKSHGIPLFPTRNGFNYVVASVDQGDVGFLMDATNKYGQINLLEERLLNWNGRILREDGTSDWTTLSPSKPAAQNFMININMGTDLHATGTAQSRFTGYSAMDYRKNFQDLSAEDTKAKLEKMNQGIELADVTLSNLNKVYEPVSLSYSFEPLTAIEQVGDKVIISPLFHLALTENPFKSEDRTYPIDFSCRRKNRYIISIVIPDGYQIESLPESTIVNLFDKTGTFSYRVNKSPAGIQVLCEQAINTPIMGPEKYQELKKFYNMILEKEQEKIVLSKI